MNRTKWKFFKNEDWQLHVKSYPKRKSNRQHKVENSENQVECPSSQQRNWIHFDKTLFCSNCNIIVSCQKHKMNWKSNPIPRRKKTIIEKPKLLLLLFPVVSKTIGLNLIPAKIVQIRNLLLISKNIKQIKK